MKDPKDLSELERYNVVKEFFDTHGVTLTLPAWSPYSTFATKKQKLRIWNGGIQNEHVIECLSKEQASLIIQKILNG